jgi:DNA-binding MarR family transcriptional regulator
LELDIFGVSNINAIQAFILMNINESVVTMGEVIGRGYYVGSNASYNIKNLIISGYIKQTQSDYDRRLAFLKLTNNGLELVDNLDKAIQAHMDSFARSRKGGKLGNIEQCIAFLRKIELFWKDVLS